jgi:DivIVA domain-containing protein
MIEWGLAAVAVLVIGVTWMAAQGRFGAMPPLIDDRPGPDLPEDGDLSADDLRDLRLAVVTRGYSMGQVDELLDRLAEQLDALNSASAFADLSVARRGLIEASASSAMTVATATLGWPQSGFTEATANAGAETALGWPD